MATTAPASSLPRGRRYGIRALLVVGTVFLVLTIFALFANRQLFNAGNWADTSTQVIQNPAVQTQVSSFLVDQLYTSVDVQAELAKSLPPRLKPLAAPVAGGLRSALERTTNLILQRPRFQQAWKVANRITAQQFINIAEGKSKAITQQGNAVVLDLRPTLTQLVLRLGLPRGLADRIPANAGKIKILTGNQVGALQDITNVLKGLVVLLPILGFGMLGLAVYLARTRRRRVLMIVGFDLIVAGVLVLLTRRIVGSAVIDSLVKTESVKPAAEAVWSIGTRLLRDAAQASVIIGIPVVFAAWLAGPTSPAVGFRRFAAPYLRERPGIVYSSVGAIVLLLIAWGPIQATRELIPVLVIIALTILGVEALRRETAEEYPDASMATATGLHMPHFGRHGNGGTTTEVGRVERLERLAVLHDTGSLSDEEFAAEKAALGS